MSYEPFVIVKKQDLEKNRKLIEAAEHDYIPKQKFKGKWAVRDRIYMEEAFEELQRALNAATVKFPELEFVIICPEGTTHNGNVRQLMDTLKIDYRIDG